MWKDCRIYLPTRGRVNDQVTLKRLPDSLLKQVHVVCHPGEEDELLDLWGDKVADVFPMGANHIGEIRQNLIEQSDKNIIIFVDDSLNFHVREKSDTGTKTKFPLKPITKKHFTQEHIDQYTNDLFRWIVDTLKMRGHYGMAGISRRASSAHTEKTYDQAKLLVENTRICSFWGINRQMLNALPGPPKFSDMQLKEDFYIVLNFLTNGVPVVMNYKYAYDRVGGANSKGGCSIYRNLENSNKSAYMLQKKFPAFVNISVKGTKSWGGEFDEKAIDVRVDWGKAYEFGRRRNIQSGFFKL